MRCHGLGRSEFASGPQIWAQVNSDWNHIRTVIRQRVERHRASTQAAPAPPARPAPPAPPPPPAPPAPPPARTQVTRAPSEILIGRAVSANTSDWTASSVTRHATQWTRDFMFRGVSGQLIQAVALRDHSLIHAIGSLRFEVYEQSGHRICSQSNYLNRFSGLPSATFARVANGSYVPDSGCSLPQSGHYTLRVSVMNVPTFTFELR